MSKCLIFRYFEKFHRRVCSYSGCKVCISKIGPWQPVILSELS